MMERKGIRPLLLLGLLAVILYSGYAFNVLEDRHEDSTLHSHTGDHHSH